MPPKKKPQKTKADAKSPKADSPSKKIKNEVKASSKNSIDWDSLPKVKPPNVKSCKEHEGSFPIDYEVVKNCLLQVTDIKDNHNKFYSLELHLATDGSTRLFTHYGRTDDLQRGSASGQKETRYYNSLAEAYAAYNDILKKKTAAGKGYKPLNLVRMNSNIGSEKIKGKSAGEIDDKTKEKLEENKKNEPEKKIKKQKSLNLHPMIQKMISYLYEEAKNTLTAAVSVQFTAEGIKTPLGVLTIEQIEKGEDCLSHILEEIQKKKPNQNLLETLSSDYFTTIPHHLGRSQAAIKSSIILTEKQYTDKMDLMQLMKDMVKVAGSKEGNVLIDPDVEAKYKALGCDIKVIEPNEKEYIEIQQYIKENITHRGVNNMPSLKGVYEITRSDERKDFLKNIGNEKLMFHGSRMANWIGILTRGVLMPQAVTKLGVHRTDFGWLGAGIYFGDVWDTSASYTGCGRDGVRYMLMVNVALGKIYDQKDINGKIMNAPKGFDTIHGNPDLHGGFSDHEYCIYKQNQQYIKYLIEFNN